VLRTLSKTENFRVDDFRAFSHQSAEILDPYGYFVTVTESGSSRTLLKPPLPEVPFFELPPQWARTPHLDKEPMILPLVQVDEHDQWAIAVQMLAATDAG